MKKLSLTLSAILTASLAIAAEQAQPSKPAQDKTVAAAEKAAKTEAAKPEAKKAAPAKAEAKPAKKAETTDPKTFYALGFYTGQNLSVFELTVDEMSQVLKGLKDGAANKKSAVEMDRARLRQISALAQERMAKRAEKEKAAGEKFIEKMLKEPGAKKLENGVVYIEKSAGTGKQPTATDKVQVHYTGTLTNGKVFDSSVERKEPATFGLGYVIPCWTEAVSQMKEGGKARVVCPSETAYGEQGQPPVIAPGATLVFDIELLKVMEPEPVPAPAAEAAKDAAQGDKPAAAPKAEEKKN